MRILRRGSFSFYIILLLSYWVGAIFSGSSKAFSRSNFHYCHVLVMSCFSDDEDPPLPSDLLGTALHFEDPPLPSDILGTASAADGPQLQELCNGVVQLPCELLRKRKISSCCKHNCIQRSSSLAALELWEEKKATVIEN